MQPRRYLPGKCPSPYPRGRARKMAKLLIAPSRGSHNSSLTSGGGKTENYAGYVGHIGTFKQIDTYRYIRWRVEAWGAYRVGPIRSVASQRASGYSRCGYSPRILAASILVFYAVLGAPSELRAYVTGIGAVALSRKAPSNLRIAKYSAITELAAAYVARVPRGARKQGCLWYAVSSGGQRMRGGWWMVMTVSLGHLRMFSSSVDSVVLLFRIPSNTVWGLTRELR